MPKQPIRVHIFNQTYTLLADGDEREIQELAHEIDVLMTSIANRASSGDSTRIAVMACLHLADKLFGEDASGIIGRNIDINGVSRTSLQNLSVSNSKATTVWNARDGRTCSAAATTRISSNTSRAPASGTSTHRMANVADQGSAVRAVVSTARPGGV